MFSSTLTNKISMVDSIFKTTKQYQIDLRCLVGSIIGLEGLIGAGKTTFGKSMVDFLNKNGIKAKFFKEFVNQKLLKQYIFDMKKYSYTFQIIMAIKRLEIYREAVEYSKTGGIAVIDRTLLGDATFSLMQYENGNYTEDEWKTYNDIIREGTGLAPTLVLYFKTNPDKAFTRMISRGYDSEKNGYTLDYFNKLHNKYIEVIDRAKKTYNVLDLEWNRDKNITHGMLDEEEIIKTIYDIRKKILS